MGAYIRDAVVYCALGNCEADIVAALKEPSAPSTQSFRFGKERRERLYGAMAAHQVVDYEAFFEILSRVINELIEKCALSSDELETCALLIGSTSMNIPCSEVAYQHSDHEMLPSIGYGRIGETLAEQCGIGGEVTMFLSACTASASALLQAQRGIASGRYDRAIVLGFEFYNEFTMSGFETLGLLSPQGCKPFDQERSGIMLGEGCSALLIDREISHPALQMSLLGGENRCDLHSPTSHNTDGKRVIDTIRDALCDANVKSDEISLIKAHATGSFNNDTAEGNGLNVIFSSLPPVVALKPLLGHTLGGCGTLELGILWMALKAGFIPKTYGFETVDKELSIVPTSDTTACEDEGVVLINHFGFGGNGTVLLVGYRRSA